MTDISTVLDKARGAWLGATISVFLAGGTVATAQTRPESAPADPAAQDSRRPRIGLALGGGAARGLAHIGIFEWMEEHRIPVDIIAGTSAGGLVGGAYASGMTTGEMRDLMNSTDWNLMFLADSPFKYKTFRRKEDARAFPGQIDFGLKNGFKLPSGLNAGQQVELMLDRIALPYHGSQDFDELPTPYRAVATDLRRAEKVVFDRGDLSLAMRATMAIPGVFTPVVDGDRVLVDGGVLDNVPADVVREAGADVVIAVSVGSGTDSPPVPANLFDVLGQTIDTFMKAGVNSSLKSADLVIVPDLKGYFSLDWRKSDEIAQRGYQAAEAMRDELLKYQLDEAAWTEWQQARQAKRRTAPPTLAFVEVVGARKEEERVIREQFAKQFAGKPFDRLALEDAILRLSGTDRYEVIDYSLVAGPQPPAAPAAPGDRATNVGLRVEVTPKSYGPPFLLPAIDLQNIDSNSFALDLRFRIAFYDTLVSNSEMRIDLGIGTSQTAAFELYRRLGGSKLFVSPRAYFHRGVLNAFNDEDDLIAEYRVKSAGAGADVGVAFGPRSELRAGFDVADVRARLRVGQPVLPEATGTDRYVSVRWVFDGQNSPLVPSRGAYVRTAFAYYFSSPDVIGPNGETILRGGDYPALEGSASWFKRLKGPYRLFLGGGAGTTFGSDPGFNQFRLGGPLRLGAFNNDEIAGENYLLGIAGLLREWFRLPDVLGGNVYYGGWFENGSAFDDWDSARYRADASGGVFVETILGPAFLGGSASLTSSDWRLYVSLAPFQR